MPELPDLTVYLEALQARIVAALLEQVQLASPFLLRTVTPPLDAARGRTVRELRRVGKRLAIGLDGGLWLVLHLMIAGRLHWFAAGTPRSRRAALARFEFSSGTLTLTEAGSKRRAALHLVEGEAGLQAQDPGGLELQGATLAQFAARLRSANHTLKRALTDPRLFSGVGNAYGDEILHAARLSPVTLTRRIDDAAGRAAVRRLPRAAAAVDRAAAGPGRGRIPGESHGVPHRHGGARSLRAAVPGMRSAGAAHPLRRQRDQLLRALPDRRPAAGRPRAVAPAEAGLAAQHRRARARRLTAAAASR